MKKKKLLKYIVRKWILITQLTFFVFLIGFYFFSPSKSIFSSSFFAPFSNATIFILFQLSLIVMGLLSSDSKILSNLSLTLISIFFCLSIAEISIRHFTDFHTKSIDFHDGINPFVSFDKELFKGYRPNSSYSFINHPLDGGDTIVYNINEDGYRGPLMNTKKGLNEFKTILIGDSFLESAQVEYKSILGSLLNKIQPDSLTFLQHGYPSYSPTLEFNWIIKKGLRYNPDRVILFLYANDFFSGNYIGDQGYRPYTIFDEQGCPDYFDFENYKTKQEQSFSTTVKNELYKFKLFTYCSFLMRRNNLQKQFEQYTLEEILTMDKLKFQSLYENRPQNDLMVGSQWDLIALMRKENLFDKNTQERVEYSLSILNTMNNYLKGKEIEFGLVYIPWDMQIPSKFNLQKTMIPYKDRVYPRSGLQDRLEAFCKQKDIQYLDLHLPFVQASKNQADKPLYLTVNRHFTRRGHKIVADEVAKQFYNN